ncbi:NAD(P)-dependent alcohol dehydrogenase [Nonomuraea basaltis]|uniref:NAD(P)-dependent alcohol dehydrogenase n=1 Tax=Nonomuraea basaltis TaxID=2495887 RepID=UPI00110C42EC|nr:NAD(P)-dependent alcohol dehydrogenase [Nonomuraea basaltis]TMR94064.1 NAD(P)-dependent alcohol dehydrogenase [Nonomuraea basaltis]
MRALRLPDWGLPPVLTDVDRPTPRDGEVLLRVEAAGLCHSDLHVIDASPGGMPFRPPFTLGHEIAGRVAAVGPAVAGIAPGDRVAVYGPWGCGECRRCSAGRDNYCDRRSELPWAGAGLGLDGGMAEYVLVPSARHLEPIGELDPVQAAPLTDAGLTPYHAIQKCRPALLEGSTVAVIGVGGLGHLAIQILRTLTPSLFVLAVDVREEALALADRCGAHLSTRMSADTGRVLRDASGGYGVDVVLDFAGTESTLDLSARSLRADGELVVVGSGGGRLSVRKPGPLPQGGRISLPFWGTRPELTEVISLARSGALRVEVERFPLSAAGEALARLRAGQLKGRAVLVPD